MTRQEILAMAFELVADELGDDPYEYIQNQVTMTATMMTIWGIVRATKATLEMKEEEDAD